MKLSVGLITFNEEKIIKKTLEAIREIANEIVIVDSLSTDRTVEIAKEMGAIVYSEEWKGFGPQKNSVIEKCKGEWILLLDADEVVSDELRENIIEIINSPDSHDVFMIKRSSICFGKKIKHGGWNSDYVIRLWKNGCVRIGEELVHEQYISSKPTHNIDQILWHYTNFSIDKYFNKFNSYTSLGAEEYFKRGKKATFIKLYLSPLFKFVKDYFFRLGFLDGTVGFLLAATGSYSVYVKYLKLYLLQKEAKKRG